MSEHENEVTPLSQLMEAEEPSPESLAEALRARRQEIAETRDTLLAIPGYEFLGLQCRHRLLDRQEVQAFSKRIMKATKDAGERQMRILAAQIINSAAGFFIQRPTDGEPVQLKDDSNNEIVRWDQLALWIGWKPRDPSNATASEALYYVFGDNEWAVGQYGISLNRWMGNTGIEVDDEFLGGAG